MLGAWVRDGYAGKFRAQLAARNAIDPARCAAMYGELRDNGAWVTPTMVLELVDSSALHSPLVPPAPERRSSVL